MDIQTEKLDLIKWIAGINDLRIIKLVKALQESAQGKSGITLSSAEKSAIDQGLRSIDKGKFQSHENVIKSTKEKYPRLFK